MISAEKLSSTSANIYFMSLSEDSKNQINEKEHYNVDYYHQYNAKFVVNGTKAF